MKKMVVAALLMVLPVLMFAADEKKGPEFSWKGEFRTRYNSQTSGTTSDIFKDGANVSDRFDTRFRLFTTAKLSDQVKAVWGLEIGDFEWGSGDRSSDMVNIETKHLYIDFAPDFAPSMMVRIGLQPILDPFNSAIFDEDAPGIVVMPKIENFDFSVGMVVYQDDDVAKKLKLSDKLKVSTDGGNAAARNVFFTQGIYKADALKIKGAFYYDKTSKVNVGTNDIVNLYFGAGLDYKTGDMTFGANYILNSYTSKESVETSEDVFEDYTRSGSLLYAFADYKKDKFNAKLHFGYTPGKDYSSNDSTEGSGYAGIKEFTSVYGLEYLYGGAVYDTTGYYAYNYGGDLGQMVIALNLSYDWIYTSVGIVNCTFTEAEGSDIGKGFGTEFDFGIKKDLTKGLEFRMVYAIASPGSYFNDMGDAFDIETATDHELSAIFKYKF